VHCDEDFHRLDLTDGPRNATTTRAVRGATDDGRGRAWLRVKYERVARYAWEPIDPDPPAPDGVKPDYSWRVRLGAGRCGDVERLS
jgi:hypothetical protein